MTARKKTGAQGAEAAVETKTFRVNTDGINLGSLGGFVQRNAIVQLPPGSPVVKALTDQGKLLPVQPDAVEVKDGD